jgi:hypothetical protein
VRTRGTQMYDAPQQLIRDSNRPARAVLQPSPSALLVGGHPRALAQTSWPVSPPSRPPKSAPKRRFERLSTSHVATCGASESH